MKYLKIFACILAAVSVASCSNDDKVEYNTNSGVTVSLASANITTKENKGFISVPVVVSGERNGYITVTCTVKEYGSEPAMSDVHYLLTSETINIEPIDDSGYFEVKLVDDNAENDPREFVVTLVDANGATLSGTQQTVITIKDNDSDPYDRIGGDWTIEGADRKIHIESMDDGEEGYGQYFLVTGLMNDCTLKMDFYYNEATEKGNLTIAYGQDVDPIEVGGSYGTSTDEIFGYIYDGSYIADDGEVVLEWNDTFTELTVVNSPMGGEYADFYLFVQLNGSWYIWDSLDGVSKFVK